ncbi:MAG: O-antigen ligase family protein [Planctomycetes bacterium]|nr:O-antigen ligase family protein [Planctomycetota bacterium]
MSILGKLCEQFLEAGWLAALILSAFFMNIYTQRMFEPDKAALVRSLAILMVIAVIIKFLEKGKSVSNTQANTAPETIKPIVSAWNSIRKSIILPAIIFYFSYLISSLLSVLPWNSFLGSYDRLQGLYTTSAYFVIFIIAVMHIKTLAQINRIINAVILTSIPVMAYGLTQKLGWDPVPWQSMDPTVRISSTMGNPIFMAAYLIMVVPITLGKMFGLISYKEKSRGWIFWLKISLYIIVIALQILCIALSQSRGPLLGLIGGFVIFLISYSIVYKKTKLLVLSISSIVLFGAFVAVLNLPKTPLEPLKKIPILERLSKLNPKEGSGRVRMILWNTAFKMMKDTVNRPEKLDPYHYSQPWRLALGYGPETIGNTFYRYHTTELVGFEGSTVHADNCHDSVINTFVTQGLFGVITFLTLIMGILYLGIKSAMKISDPESKLVTIGIVSAILSHFIESLFGLQIVVTLTHFWIFIAALYFISQLANTRPDETKNNAKPDNADLEIKNKKKNQIKPPEHEIESFGMFLLRSIFWTYIGVTIVVVIMVVKFDWPNMETVIVNWIGGTYLYILLGLLMGALSLTGANKDATEKKNTIARFMNTSSFNIIPYGILITAGFILIFLTNLKPILADGFYKFAFSADSEITKSLVPEYMRAKNLWYQLYYQEATGKTLTPDQQKQKESAYKHFKQKLGETLNLRIHSLLQLQKCLKLSPNEPTYLNGMGRHYMELAMRQWDDLAQTGIINMNERTNQLSKIPDIHEIINFTGKDYIDKFTKHDLMLCCRAVIERAYKVEPTNFERLIAMARVYQSLIGISAPSEQNFYREKAAEFYQKSYDVAPSHPTAQEGLKLRQELLKTQQPITP